MNKVIGTDLETTALVLQKMKETAEEMLGEEVTQAVIIVSPYFNDSQRQVIKNATKIAALEDLYILNERADHPVVLFELGGSRYWRLKSRFNGEEKFLALGVYPEFSL